mgnify:CR=1 FL=1
MDINKGKLYWTNYDPNHEFADKAQEDKKFEKIELEVKAGSAILMHSSVLHCGYPTKKRGSVRIIVTERYNPLQKIPFLKNENAPMKIPFVGVDYNKIVD